MLLFNSLKHFKVIQSNPSGTHNTKFYHNIIVRLVSNFGRVCERRKLIVNIGKSEVMRCSRYGNGDRMHVILNGEPLEEVDCFKHLPN